VITGGMGNRAYPGASEGRGSACPGRGRGTSARMTDEEHDERAAPSGLPEGAPESTPLGPTHADPDGEGQPKRGPGQMPGMPGEREPPTSG
jgi:hypothetical protein